MTVQGGGMDGIGDVDNLDNLYKKVDRTENFVEACAD